MAGIAALLFLPALAGAATGASVATLSYLGKSGFPRGMRNNNPGNIRIGAAAWQGKIPVSQNTDGAFEQFTAYVYGIRAMTKNLLSYASAGINTLHGIIYKWAPPQDNNDTAAYVAYVANKTGINPTQPLNLKDKNTMRRIVQAMTEVENGRQGVVTTEQFNYAWSII